MHLSSQRSFTAVSKTAFRAHYIHTQTYTKLYVFVLTMCRVSLLVVSQTVGFHGKNPIALCGVLFCGCRCGTIARTTSGYCSLFWALCATYSALRDVS